MFTSALKIFSILLFINLLLVDISIAEYIGYKVENEKSIEEININDLDFNDYLRDTSILYGGLWVGRFFYVRNKNARIFETSLSDWWDNISRLPVTDDGDEFFTNYITHPYLGSIYYLYYRRMEHDFLPSALGSFIQSTLFEYTIEGLVEPPSLTDLIVTPGIGVPVGYVLEKTSDWLDSKDRVVFQVAAKLVNPMKLFIDDRKILLLNPATGSFEYRNEFQYDKPPIKTTAVKLSYPLFFETAIPRGYFTALVEVINLKNEAEGQFILYHAKAEFPTESFESSFYIRFSQGGVDNMKLNGERIRDGFEFANLLAGYKSIVAKGNQAVLTVGAEVLLPTAYKDNVDRLKTIVIHKRDFPIYLTDAVTISPYISFAVWKKYVSLQGNLTTDLVLRANDFENDDTEWRMKYNLATGAHLPMEGFSPTVFAEFNGINLITADTTGANETYITSGLRFGSRFRPGIAIQYPMSGDTSEIAELSYIVDLRVKF